MVNKLKKHKNSMFWIIVILMAVIKQILVMSIPLLAYSNQEHDDLLMVRMAYNILDGHWLGGYNENTLVKGAVFPLLLAFINKIGVSYIECMTILYSLACIIFCMAIRPLFERRKLLLILYVILLFNPASYAAWTMQRVYRNGITLVQVLLIFGGVFAIYLRRNLPIKKSLGWSIITGIVLATMWHTREDGIWIMPFILVASCVLIILAIFQYRKNSKRKELACRIIVSIIPLLVLGLGNYAVRTVNYIAYGVFTYNEINDGSFSDAMKSIYSVKCEEDIQYVTVTREKMSRLYKISPSLNAIKDELEESLNAWDYNDRNPGDGQVEDGWFFWSLRSAVREAGYADTASEAEEYYANVSQEIENALDKKNSIVERQNTMPSAIMSPWKQGYFEQLTETMINVANYVINLEEVFATNAVSTQTEENGIRLFETLTNDIALYPPENDLLVEGWYVQYGNNNGQLAIINEKDEILQFIETYESEDVYSYLVSQGLEEESGKKCRFNVTMGDVSEILYLGWINFDGDVLNRIPLDCSTLGENTSEYAYYFDVLKNGNTDLREQYTEKYVNRLNMISGIYQKCNIIIFIISCLAFIAIIVRVVRKKRTEKDIECLIVNGSMIASLIVLIGGVSYNEITSCASIRYMYLSAAYPLMLAIEGITILYIIDKALMKRGERWIE